MLRLRAAERFPLLSYPLSPTAARGVMSGPRSSRTSNCGLSLAWPSVRWNASGCHRGQPWGGSWSRSPRASGPALDRVAPFGTCGRDVGAHHGGVEHLNQVRRAAQTCERIEERLEHARPAQAPEALPDRVPVPELCRERPPGDVVEREDRKSTRLNSSHANISYAVFC